MNKTLIAAALATALAGCASTETYPPSRTYYEPAPSTSASTSTSATTSTPAGRAAAGAAIGAVAGNVLGYLTDSDRKTATLLGAVIGGGVGYWQGLQADRRLQEAQAASADLARVQAAQNTYRYDQPRLYAREVVQGGQKVASFDKLETPFPNDAIRYRSTDAEAVLNKLGSLAARTDASVTVYAPTAEMRDYMVSELRQGSGGINLNISTAYSAESRVVIGHVSPSA